MQSNKPNYITPRLPQNFQSLQVARPGQCATSSPFELNKSLKFKHSTTVNLCIPPEHHQNMFDTACHRIKSLHAAAVSAAWNTPIQSTPCGITCSIIHQARIHHHVKALRLESPGPAFIRPRTIIIHTPFSGLLSTHHMRESHASKRTSFEGINGR